MQESTSLEGSVRQAQASFSTVLVIQSFATKRYLSFLNSPQKSREHVGGRL